MRRRGIDENLISRELHCMEIEIRSRLHRSVTGGAR
jgi:hypothetical protein